jgi:hypothetical protein
MKNPNGRGARIGLIVAAFGGLLVLTALIRLVNSATNDSGRPVLSAPVDVLSVFTPSGWMGDAQEGRKYVQLTEVSPKDEPWRERPRGKILNFTTQPGPQGWVGVGWQYPEGNWGQHPGVSLKGAKKLTFWAAGSQGGEVLEFKIGGIRDKTKGFSDSVEVSLPQEPLLREGQRYEISLQGENLSNVIMGFVWISTSKSNPRPISFYLSDVRFENEPPMTTRNPIKTTD